MGGKKKALSYVCERGDVELVKKVISYHVDNFNYISLGLGYACKHGNHQVVKYFIELGADVNYVAYEDYDDYGHCFEMFHLLPP